MPLVRHAALTRRELEQIRVLGERVLQVRVALEFAEQAPEGDVLFDRRVLIRQEQHLVLQQQGAQGSGIRLAGVRQPGAQHLGTQ